MALRSALLVMQARCFALSQATVQPDDVFLFRCCVLKWLYPERPLVGSEEAFALLTPRSTGGCVTISLI